MPARRLFNPRIGSYSSDKRIIESVVGHRDTGPTGWDSASERAAATRTNVNLD
jgi:hypothetical protein